MPKQARSFMTRDRIVESAASAFERFGYAATTLNDIVRASGTTKGSVYFHFNSKEQVAAAVVEAQHARSIELASQIDVKRGLEAAIEVSYDLAKMISSDPLVRAGIRLTLEQGGFSATVRNPYVDWIAATNRFITEAVADGEMRSDLEPDEVANMLVGSYTGLQTLSEVLSGRADLRDRLSSFWRIVLPAFVAPRKLAYFQGVNARAASAWTS